jgi:hypothetical protein
MRLRASVSASRGTAAAAAMLLGCSFGILVDKRRQWKGNAAEAEMNACTARLQADRYFT